MSETGKNVIDGFRELRGFCEDVHRLLKTADGLMQQQDWKPIRRSSVVGYTSTAIDEWAWWLPIEFVRHYRHARRELRHRVPYVAVLLDDPEDACPLSEALLAAGWIDYGVGKKRRKPDRENYYWLCRSHLWMPNRVDDGTLFCDRNLLHTWEGEKLPVGVVTIASFAYPLDEITSTNVLESKIIKPLLVEIAKDMAPASTGARH